MTYRDYKNGAKHILFSVLVITMIIPVAGINVANAEDSSQDPRLAQVKAKLESLREEARTNPDKEQDYQRLSIAIQMYEIQNKIANLEKNNAPSEKIDTLRTAHLDLSEKYQQYVSQDKLQTIDSTQVNAQTSSGETPWFTNVSRTNCGDDSSNGQSSGIITASANSAFLEWFYNYPSSIKDGSFPNCTTKNFTSGWIQWHDSAQGDGCIVFEGTHQTSGSGTCNNIKSGDFVVITAQGFYNTSTAFGQPGSFATFI